MSAEPTSKQFASIAAVLLLLALGQLVIIGILHGIGGKATDWDLLCIILFGVFGFLGYGANEARKEAENKESLEKLRRRTQLND